MTTTTILSDNGASSGSAGLKTTGGNDGTLALQTTTSGGTATTALAIDTSQNVGIGTASPARTLHVAGVEAVATVANDAALLFYPTNTDNRIYSRDGASTTGNLPLTFYTGISERMRIDSSGIVTGTAGNLMLVSGVAVASTSGTSINFTGIPSWAKRITMIFNGVSLSASANYLVQLGTGGTPTYVTSGYSSAGSQSSDAATPSIVTSTAGHIIRSAASNRLSSGHIVLTNISSTIWVSSHAMGVPATSTIAVGGGTGDAGATVTAIRVTTTSTDTFDAGSINILYE